MIFVFRLEMVFWGTFWRHIVTLGFRFLKVGICHAPRKILGHFK